MDDLGEKHISGNHQNIYIYNMCEELPLDEI
jgi:hypothetical protein